MSSAAPLRLSVVLSFIDVCQLCTIHHKIEMPLFFITSAVGGLTFSIYIYRVIHFLLCVIIMFQFSTDANLFKQLSSACFFNNLHNNCHKYHPSARWFNTSIYV